MTTIRIDVISRSDGELLQSSFFSAERRPDGLRQLAKEAMDEAINEHGGMEVEEAGALTIQITENGKTHVFNGRVEMRPVLFIDARLK